MKPTRLKGIYEMRKGKRNALYTVSYAPKTKVYDENILKKQGKEFREWDPKRSKLSAAILKGASQIGIKPGVTVLYLGASYGTTPSHVSDIVGKDGFVFALDFAPRVVRDLVFVCKERDNMAPILASANHPETYAHMVTFVDVVYQDIAQRSQADIFLKNCRRFLKKGGFALLCVKSRSVDITKKPKQVFEMVRRAIERELTIADYRILDPFQKDHCMFICKKK